MTKWLKSRLTHSPPPNNNKQTNKQDKKKPTQLNNQPRYKVGVEAWYENTLN